MEPTLAERVRATERPPGRAVMWQEWRDLAFFHWTVDPAALRAHIPAELEIDTFAGQAYIGMVPFRIRGTRPPRLVGLPWVSSFLELNLRTYVHRQGHDPGVWFFSLDAARLLAVIGARVGYSLPYFHARMSSTGSRHDGIAYSSTRLRPSPTPATFAGRFQPRGVPSAASPGTLEHFLLERYILYAVRRGTLLKAHVHHRPYSAQGLDVSLLDQTLLAAHNLPGTGPPALAHFSPGVNVEIFAPHRA